MARLHGPDGNPGSHFHWLLIGKSLVKRLEGCNIVLVVERIKWCFSTPFSLSILSLDVRLLQACCIFQYDLCDIDGGRCSIDGPAVADFGQQGQSTSMIKVSMCQNDTV